MTVESFHPGKQFAVVAGGDEDLGVLAHGGLEQGEGTAGEFVGFEEGELVFGEFGAGFGEEGSMRC